MNTININEATIVKKTVPFDISIIAPPSIGPIILPTLNDIAIIKFPAGKLCRGVKSVIKLTPKP